MNVHTGKHWSDMHGCDVLIEDGDLILSSLTWEISSTSGEECGALTGEVA